MLPRAIRRIEPSGLHRLLYRLAAAALFDRIVIRGESPKASGPTLFVGLHRNGAIDGIAYLPAAPKAAYLLSAQLHRSIWLRALFPGITVVRQKDRAHDMEGDNRGSLEVCVARLVSGGSLFVLPEGTSTLGPRHLPFRPGAAQVASAVLAAGRALTIVPLAVHYERAWAWQSRAEVVIGEPLYLQGPSAGVDALAGLMTRALESVGVNVASEGELRTLEALAFIATLSGWDYSAALKQLEGTIPEGLRESFEALQATARWSGSWSFQDVPLVPLRPLAWEALALLALVPIVAVSLLSNFPPLLFGALAARWLPDDRNVVAFWRALIGLPCAALWAVGVTLALLVNGAPWLALGYIVLSTVGLRWIRPLKMRAVAVHNALFAPKVIQPMRALTQAVAEHLRHA
jgi:1-acyl-sn-glycerol-3-phosphate acyltransferase